MYKNDYAMCVMHNGMVLEEKDRRVMLPFTYEYKVRLINKHSKRAACDLFVNGEEIARFVLPAGKTSDIERFLDGNMSSGKKFMFVGLGDGRVKDKRDIDNGLIEAHFYLESEPQIKEIHHHHHHDDWDRKPYIPPVNPYVWPPVPWGTQWEPYGDPHRQFYGSMGSSTGYNSEVSLNNCKSMSSDLEGATVRGSKSDQEFKTTTGTFESIATILKIKIVNGSLLSAVRYCSKCSRKRKHGEKYCSQCGNRY